MAHAFLTAPHFKHINSRVSTNHGSIDVIVEWANWRTLVHEIEVDGVSIQNLSIEA
jgi:Holliday junction resolvase-like predicted endonuclease